MDKEQSFKFSFRLIGVYDILLGFAFLFFFREIYNSLNITLPNHPGYIYVPALFVACGGVGEFLIAQNPLRNVDLVIVRMLMKLTFVLAIVFCYVAHGIPTIFLIISVLSVIGIIKNLLFIRWANQANQT